MVVTTNDLKMFPDEGGKALEKSVQRMIKSRVLMRVSKGLSASPDVVKRHRAYMIERVAKALRPGYFSYLSL